jgi:hypothetical protein
MSYDHGMMTLPKYNPGTGAWFRKKKDHKKARGHQTAGSMKGETCKASYLDRHMAKSSRSYKHPLYGNWLAKTDKY